MTNSHNQATQEGMLDINEENNLLHMINGNAELAMEEIPEWNPVYANIKAIKSAGTRATDIVSQLLKFSRKTDQTLKPMRALTIIQDALKFLRSTIPTSIEIRQHFPGMELTIRGDSTQINQLMMNLCINASQAMAEQGGILEITVEKFTFDEEAIDHNLDLTPGEWLKMTVSDTGPGIEPDIIDRIFDPYFTTKDVGTGSGIGLAVVHGIVKNHNGRIYVDSVSGKGTTFTIFIPVVTEQPMMEEKKISKIPKGNGEKILVVDDEASIVKMIGKMLEHLGYVVETKTSPKDALELFRMNPDLFDLVLTDMTMPHMTGLKLSEKLKEVRQDIPVIICAGYSPLIDEEKVKDLDVEAYVMKPIGMVDISQTIWNVLKTT